MIQVTYSVDNYLNSEGPFRDLLIDLKTSTLSVETPHPKHDFMETMSISEKNLAYYCNLRGVDFWTQVIIPAMTLCQAAKELEIELYGEHISVVTGIKPSLETPSSIMGVEVPDYFPGSTINVGDGNNKITQEQLRFENYINRTPRIVNGNSVVQLSRNARFNQEEILAMFRMQEESPDLNMTIHNTLTLPKNESDELS